jgi:H+/gluconate symporter-like permease
MVVLVPAIVIGLIIKKKTEPLIALLAGTLLAAVLLRDFSATNFKSHIWC